MGPGSPPVTSAPRHGDVVIQTQWLRCVRRAGELLGKAGDGPCASGGVVVFIFHILYMFYFVRSLGGEISDLSELSERDSNTEKLL